MTLRRRDGPEFTESLVSPRRSTDAMCDEAAFTYPRMRVDSDGVHSERLSFGELHERWP
jgi:hypothetical protein